VSKQDEPLEGIPVLGYAGGGGTAGGEAGAVPAFNAFRRWTWSGEHLFRVYLTPEFVYFIRIGGARNQEQALYFQFGLIGWIVGHFMAKSRRKKEEARVYQMEGKFLEKLLSEHKKNFVFPTGDITDVALESGGWSSGGLVKLSFNVKGEKKRLTMILDKVEDVHIAIRRLPQWFPGARVGIEFNEKKKKYVKAKK
jgi:hypothetical protein